jgi:flagellar hook-associated protein 2
MSVAASSSSSATTLSGLASGLDWTTLINEMVTAQEAPETQMKTQVTNLQTENTAYTTLGTDLTALQKDAATLKDSSFFGTVTASASDSSVASATAAAGTPVGDYTFNVTKLATASAWKGTTATANPLSTTDSLDGVTVANAGLATSLTAGTFTVNGQQITIASTDTLQSVLSQITNKTGVSASYSSSTDKITLSSSSPIVLGNENDTSNFLQATQLYNNGGDSVASASALGGISLNNTLGSANLGTTVNDGGSGKGEFKINGVAINFDASTDSISSVLQAINDSSAGVTATFDSATDQFQLTNTSTGNVGISLEDVSGNFLAATGLSGGKLSSGNNLQYSVNGGGTLTSQSNTVDAGASGITGLSITALGTGSTTISVASDTSTIASTINSFVTDYNTVQNYIKSEAATTTSSTGTVTPGTLTGDMDVEGIADELRRLTNATANGLSGEAVQNLNDMGITSNGTDNTLKVDSATLNSALANHLSDVKKLFTDSASGLATKVNTYLTNTTGDSGILATKEAGFTKQEASINTSITNLQSKISQYETDLKNEFVQMEDAINTINTQKTYLTDFFNEPTSSSAAPAASSVSSGTSSDSSSSSSSSSS